MDKISKECNLF